jgi:triacylglycerol lipase
MSDFASHLWMRLTALAGMMNFAAAAPAAEKTVSRRPVLLIHGIYNSEATMKPMRRWLEHRGWEVHTLSLAPSSGRIGLPTLAKQVSTYVENEFPKQTKIDLVGFSMGGIVCRYYLQKLGGADRVHNFVSISAPNHGTLTAYLSNAEGCAQMRPGSSFLADLNENSGALSRVNMTCLWTPLDLVIIPARSSQMREGKGVCCWSLAHPLMILQPSCLKQVELALRG